MSVKMLLITAFALILLACPALTRADEKHAIELIDAMGCRGCHKIGKNGGSFGPSLDEVAKRLEKKKIRQKLVKPKADNPSSLMPSFAHLSDADLDTLTDYLSKLK